MNYLNKNFKLTLIAGLLSLILTIPAFAVTPTITTDAKLQYNKGVDYWKLGQLEQSVECFKKAVDLDPNYIDAYYNLGILLEHLKQDDAALNVFKQILLRKPDDYEAVYKAAELSKKIGEHDKAQMYLELIPKDTLIGQKAKQLSDSLEVTTKNEIPQENESTTSQNDGFNNITSPTGIVTDSIGNVFVAGYSDNTIYKIDNNNQKIVYIKDSKIDGPIGLAIDSEGNIYITNYNKNNILKVTPTGIISEFVTDIQKPYCMYVSNGTLYVSAQGSNAVLKYKI